MVRRIYSRNLEGVKAVRIIFLYCLGGGGAERVAVNLFKQVGFDYILVLDERENAYDFPSDRLHVLRLPAFGELFGPDNLLKRMLNFSIKLLRLRSHKKERGVTLCLSFLEPCNLLNVLTKGKEKVVLSFQIHYTQLFEEDPFFGSGFKRWLITGLYRIAMSFFYNRADLMVCASYGVKEDLVRNFGIDSRKVRVIYNPIYLDEVEVKSKESLGEYEGVFSGPVLINVGRLTKQKGQWYLLRVFRVLKDAFPDLRLVFLGDGELRGYLYGLSRDLGLRSYLFGVDDLSSSYDVYFLGFQGNPFKFLSRSTLFVFPSLFEGFGNVLVEALACGVPVVSSDCRSGPREVLSPGSDFSFQTDVPEYGEYGILMPVIGSDFRGADEPLCERERIWCEVLRDLLADEGLRRRYSLRGKERAKDFDIAKIAEEWKRVLEGL